MAVLGISLAGAGIGYGLSSAGLIAGSYFGLSATSIGWTVGSLIGNALFAPLFFDMDPRRFARRMTWRQLTITESPEIQPADVAVGYRVQLGKEQWLIYRSLAQQANRTLLGHNLSTEMLVARFDPTGEVEALVEIE